MDRTHESNQIDPSRDAGSGRGANTVRAIRRGTVLILVLGVLALLAVITAVYVSIGQADRRTGETVRRSKTIDEAADRAGDYIAGVIAADAVSTVFERPAPSGNVNKGLPPALRREAVDYPYTGYPFRSILPGQTTAQRSTRDGLRFDPAGSVSTWPVPGITATAIDPRPASDPWLAATEPTYMGPDATDDLGSQVATDQYKNNLDWAHISNIGPDGRYVNLFNLRAPSSSNTIAPNVGVGFDARTWELSGMSVNGTSVTKLNTAAQLSFLQLANSQPDENPPAPSVNPNFAIVTNAYTNDYFNRPAFYSNAQRYAFRPMDVSDGLDWRSPDFIRYQWADADGDGFADSRWQELADASDPTNVVNLMPGGEYRWFIAARIIDMSGLVNVNTARDFLSPGTPDVPTGFSPADVDLRRLLMMVDVPGQTAATIANGAKSGGYSGVRNPPSDIAALPQYVPSDYAEYRDANGAGLRALKSGSFAYAAVVKALLSGTTPAGGFDLTADPAVVDPMNSQTLAGKKFDWTHGPFGNFSRVGQTDPFTPLINPFGKMMSFQEAAAAAYRGDFARGGARGYFGASDLSELFTYRASNDDALLSRLEQTMEGRLPPTDAANAGAGSAYDNVSLAARFGPLRASRDAEWERRGRAVADDPATPLVRGINPAALQQMAYDVRKYQTTMSGSRPLASRPIEYPYATDVTARKLDDRVDLRVDVPSSLGAAIFQADKDLKLTGARDIFKGYLDSLAPFVGESPTAVDWLPTNNVGSWTRRTLAYGYEGPELAFNLSAHLTMNLIDAYDDDATPVASGNQPPVDVQSDTPSVVTVVLDKSLLNVLTSTSEAAKSVTTRDFPFAASGDGLRFPPEKLKTPDPANPGQYLTGADQVLPSKLRVKGSGNTGTKGLYSPAKNVYGMEAFPIVTQAVTMFMYADTPSGSADITHNDPFGGSTINPTIDGELRNGNEDLLLSAFAVQIHNPFDKEIRLTAGPSGEFLYYVQFGGRAYKLCDSDVNEAAISVSLAANETRWFYFACDIEAFDNRWKSFEGGAATSGFLENLIAQQLGVDVAGGAKKPAHMLQFDPTTGTAVKQKPFAVSPRILDGDQATTDSDENRVVRLWRAIRLGGQGDVPGAQANAVENDLLVDRLRDPRSSFSGKPLLSRRLAEKVIEVGNVGPSDAGIEDKGLTILLVNSIRRHDETSLTPIGAIPAYMIESGLNTSPLKNLDDYNSFGATDYLADVLTLNDFQNSAVQTATETPGEFRAEIYDKKLNALPQSALGDPDKRYSNPIGNNLSSQAFEKVRPTFYLPNNRLTTKFYNVGPTGTGSAVADQPLPGVIRLGDLLSQLAIGAEFDPWRGIAPDFSGELATDTPDQTLNGLKQQIATNAWTSGSPGGGNPDRTKAEPDDPRWLTVGEMLAMALDYDAGRQQSNTSIPNPYYRLGRTLKDPNPATRISPKLVRGSLVLDDYTPYENVAAPNVVAYNAPDPNNPTLAADKIRGLGVPVALNVLSNFRTLGQYRIDAVQNNGLLDISRNPMGDLSKPVPGLININTAPLAVLRLLPLLSPTQGADPFSNTGAAEWWGKGTTADDLDNPMGLTTRNSDIAARIVAYRDKLWRQPTRKPLTGTIQLLSYGNDLGNGATRYAQDGIGGGNGRYKVLNPTTNPTRELVVREFPGFQSIGEIMLATDRDRSSVDPAQKPDPNSMDFLGRDTTDGQASGNQRVVGAPVKIQTINGKKVLTTGTSRLYADRGASGTNIVREFPSGVANTADERLAVFNAIANSISVSSDYYACWFVLHGYKRTDVEGLKDGEPMIPTVARRYLMIIDRSNVKTQTDRPRVVVFKELPM